MSSPVCDHESDYMSMDGAYASPSSLNQSPKEASPVSPTSSHNSTAFFCRICFEDERKEALMAPCKCTGSIGWVHLSCLKKWLTSTNTVSCDLCNHKFPTISRDVPAFQWFSKPSKPEDRRHLMADFMCGLLLTPLAALSSYLCIAGAYHYATWRSKWESSGLICLSAFLLAIYGLWAYVTFKYHLDVWREWRSTHLRVEIVELASVATQNDDIENPAILVESNSRENNMLRYS